MSFLGIFGGNKKEKVPSPQEAIQRLQETATLLEKKTDFLEKKIDAETTTAKKNASSNKRVALQALKRKKRLEKQLIQLDGTLSTIEFQVDMLQNANTNIEVIRSMKFASDALKQAQMDPDDVHDIMDELEEQLEVSSEVSSIISSHRIGDDIDEDDLNAELAELEAEDDDDVTLPDVPIADLPEIRKQKEPKIADDGDMKELEAWAAT